MPRDPDTKPKLALPFRLFNALEGALPSRIASLDEEDLCRAAIMEAGSDDFGDNDFRRGLRAAITSARDDANLHLIGRLTFRSWTINALVNRLMLAQARCDHPDVFEEPLRPPLIITGLPRTGTTLLHRLLASDTSNRAVPMSEMLRPIPPGGPGADDGGARRRRVARELRLRRVLMPNIDAKHFIRAETPEEDLWILASSFVSSAFWVVAPLYGYARWLVDADRRRKYSEYRDWLHVFQYADPTRRLVLKAPDHLAGLGELLDAVPEAVVVQTHRDPVDVLPSLNSLFHTTHSAVSRALDLDLMADLNLQLLSRAVESRMAVRHAHRGRIVDVAYRDLTREPVGVARRIYEAAELEWTREVEEKLRDYVVTHPQGRHGEHRYAASDFGQSSDEIAASFRRYRQEFLGKP